MHLINYRLARAVITSVGVVAAFLLLQWATAALLMLWTTEIGWVLPGVALIIVFFTVGVLVTQGKLGAVFFAHAMHQQAPKAKGFGKKSLALWRQALALLLLFWLASEFLAHFLGRQPEAFMRHILNTQAFWLVIAALVVLAPLYEELIFRGVIFDLLMQAGNQCTALVISSVLFALVHGQYDGFGVLLIFVLGLLLGWAKLRSGSLLLSMVLHALNNIAAVAVFLWQK